MKEKEHVEAIRAHIVRDAEALRGSGKPSNDYTETVLTAILQNQSRELIKSHRQPHFARIFFKEHGRTVNEDAYIGRFGIFERETLQPIVLDWRSPIANLYYNDAFENVSVDVDPKHPLTFDLERKRQFEFRDGSLEAFYDSENGALIDRLLLERLSARSGDKLQDIVETIQAEQNRIIRADARENMVVQGVAGSGKTTIALHRLSYLAYQKRNNAAHTQFLVIAPNRVFLDYIANVLPDLGVEGVAQYTWEDLTHHLLPKKTKFASEAQKRMLFFEESDDAKRAEQQIIIHAARLRGSMAFARLLLRVVEKVAKQIVPDADLVLSPRHQMPKEEIARRFFDDYRYEPYLKRRKRLLDSLARFAQDAIKEEIARFDKRLTKGRYADSLEQSAKIKAAIEERYARYVRTVKNIDIYALYRKVLSSENNVSRVLAELSDDLELNEQTKRYVLARYAEADRTLEWEDSAALLFLTRHFHGFAADTRYAHMIVDEAQDLSAFQIFVLTKLSPNATLSIFGDVSQSISPYKGLTSWDEVTRDVFAERAAYKTLEQSYRSTVEIVTFANRALQRYQTPGIPLAKPVLRHGVEPEILQTDETHEVGALIELISRIQSEGYKQIAVVEKTIAACSALQDRLQKDAAYTLPLLSEKTEHYEGGLHLMPIYMSKGLEFDAVIVLNPSEHSYDARSSLHAKLLYVACTRALHRLYILQKDPLTPLLQAE
ncbi:HelD family protein [Ferroacidibacillus organovorans]|uniref:UvrD-like helicase ATP-binding domain-containing protein n=1 Tax=Ferroacidibacillus organovorans TaxID=1765683 RepID=A0A161QFU0_9BACL|nr:UvrD-helicase domain-containing protein [Ferroacidibacillus organovorans]KYP80850.1 hypothetical protein AYJ22_01450 [Ferroacidibacillus organovorans]OAG95395.1 hypothetical protein AYW79_00330 [Ferroacidibacillus organovorans]OPG15768.1 hypothetical protein B2M26_09110 [Ferroacidibacillus organovorans]